ncbi:hypothetical protein [Streptomyces sp. NPDC056192]|uniref:hypothetical protein n=1 Tax=Streptomyces sp. NPDC056192 TaxID=3345743 RepID=UPI0035E182B5
MREASPSWEMGGSITIGESSSVQVLKIRPWTKEERLVWYRTGRNLHRPRWMYQAIIDDHPELPDLDRSWDNLYGDGFE